MSRRSVGTKFVTAAYGVCALIGGRLTLPSERSW